MCRSRSYRLLDADGRAFESATKGCSAAIAAWIKRGLTYARTLHIESSDGNNSDLEIAGGALDPNGAAAHLQRPQTRPNDFSIEGGKASTTIPITLVENHVNLDVMLNGKGPYHFIFDTGGSNVVDPAVAKEIGAVGSGSAQGNGVGSQTESLSFARVRRVSRCFGPLASAVMNGRLICVSCVVDSSILAFSAAS